MCKVLKELLPYPKIIVPNEDLGVNGFIGNPNLDGSDFKLLWIYLVFMNGLWVVLPALLLWDSVARISYVSEE